MRVLYFVDGFWPLIGGLEVISAQLVTGLAARGYEITVVTNREHDWIPEEEMFGAVTVRRLPFFRAIHDRDLELVAASRRGVAEIVRAVRPHLVHASFTGAGAMMLPKPEVAPLILSFHGPWETVDFSAGLFGRVLARTDWVTACSQHTLAALMRTAPPEIADRASVILNGIDPPAGAEPEAPPAGPPVLLCSGRVVDDKGFDVAVDAMAGLPGARLVIAGDGDARAGLEARARALGVDDRVTFAGWVSPDDMPALVARSTVVLAPSRLEGFGLTALEAALMGRPVVASDIGGHPEVVQDGVTGVLVACDDAAALADAVARLLAAPEAARRMGEAGRRRALAEFSARRHVDEWDALYRRVGNMGRSADG